MQGLVIFFPFCYLQKNIFRELQNLKINRICFSTWKLLRPKAFMLLPPYFLSFLSVFSVDSAQGLVGPHRLGFSEQTCLPYMENEWSGLPPASFSSAPTFSVAPDWCGRQHTCGCSAAIIGRRLQKTKQQTLQESSLVTLCLIDFCPGRSFVTLCFCL